MNFIQKQLIALTLCIGGALFMNAQQYSYSYYIRFTPDMQYVIESKIVTMDDCSPNVYDIHDQWVDHVFEIQGSVFSTDKPKYSISSSVNGRTTRFDNKQDAIDFRTQFLKKQKINHTGWGNSNGFTIQLIDALFDYECN